MSFITNRKKSRKLLYQILFYKTFQKIDLELFYATFFEWVFSFQKDDKYINSMLKIIENKEDFFIYIIKKFSPKFDFEKMSSTYIIPVYISLAEIFFLEEEIPLKASINEAIELAKTYSDDSAKKIVNGILDSVSKNYKKLEEEKDNFKENYNYSIFK